MRHEPHQVIITCSQDGVFGHSTPGGTDCLYNASALMRIEHMFGESQPDARSPVWLMSKLNVIAFTMLSG